MKNIPFFTSRFPETKAGGFDRYDGTVQFYARVNALLRPEYTVLDFGAGRGVSHIDDEVEFRRQLVRLRGKVKEVIGADVDEVVATNPGVDKAIVLRSTEIPLPDASVDLILSDFTFEHIPEPGRTASELNRVLKPGGWICARTPNRMGYIALSNRLVPSSLRNRTLGGAQPSRKAEDVFPAFYRFNTVGALKQYFPESSYEHASYTWDALPAYHFNRGWLFRAFSVAQYVTPPALRTVLLIFLNKKNG